MSDILTRLLLNTSDYDSKLKKAKGSTNNFASNIGGKAAALVGKFAAGIGVAMGGVEAFNRVIQSSQTLGDNWNNTINACKGTVDAFFQSLATGNWDAFNQGLSGAISNMYRISALKDMLEDAKLTMGFDTKKFEREYVRLEGIIDDETKSKSERESAFAEMEALIERFKGRVNETAKGAANTLVSEMNAKFGQNFTLQDLETYIEEVNNGFLNTETLQRLNDYKAKLDEFKDGRSRAINGYVLTKEQFIEQNSFLEKMRILQEDSNESRKSMIAQIEYANDLYRRADEYLKRSLEKQNKIASLNKGSVVDKPKKTEIPVYVGYSNYYTDMGKKVLDWMNGKDVPIIKVPIEIDEEMIDEEPLPGLKNKVDELSDVNAELAVFGQMMNMVNGSTIAGADNWLQWMNNVVQATSTAVNAIRQVVTAKTAEGAASAGASAAQSGPFGWLAIAPAIMSALAAFASIPKFADGGIVGGSSYFGDKLLARVNSGEMILNQSQQSRLFNMMDGGNVRVSGDVRLNGKDIYISLRNYMSSSGNRL